MSRTVSGCLLLLPAMLLPACGAGEPGLPPWTVAVVMSYDNDLEPHAAVILDRLQTGVLGSRNTVTVLADYRGPGGLVRYEITGEGRGSRRLETDDSASSTVVAGFLDWAVTAHPARRYAVVFLDHGGGLDEMCQDLDPAGPPGGRWLSGREMGPILATLREKTGGRLELVFLQQCGRATVEGLYNFRGCAPAILASQTRVGAPNTWYEPVLRWLAENPGAGGPSVAERILRTDYHFNSYVCVDGFGLAELPPRLDEVVAEVMRSCRGTPRAPEEPALCFRSWIRPDERVYDLLDWLGALYDANGMGPADSLALAAFRDWVESSLILSVRRHPRTAHLMERWTGLGLYVPELASARERYRGYPLYRDSRLAELWARLYP
jgi:hypothetical protein